MSEDDDLAVPRTGSARGGGEDNSLPRLLTLCDGIFAIAMTLLALDLKVPDVGDDPSEHELVHALAQNANSYWSYLLTFYVVGGYWVRHRRLMRSVVVIHADMIRDTLLLLLFVAAMPFPASLLGRYGGEPISLALYGAINAAATIMLMLLSWDVRRLHLADSPADEGDYAHHWRSWLTLAVFLLAIPAGFLFDGNGAWVFVLLAVPDRVVLLLRIGRRLRKVPTG